MPPSSILFTLASCVFFMGLVGWISWFKTRGTVDDKDGYFLAGRGLGVFIQLLAALINDALVIALVYLPKYISDALQRFGVYPRLTAPIIAANQSR